jgi:hypothetical protein
MFQCFNTIFFFKMLFFRNYPLSTCKILLMSIGVIMRLRLCLKSTGKEFSRTRTVGLTLPGNNDGWTGITTTNIVCNIKLIIINRILSLLVNTNWQKFSRQIFPFLDNAGLNRSGKYFCDLVRAVTCFVLLKFYLYIIKNWLFKF